MKAPDKRRWRRRAIDGRVPATLTADGWTRQCWIEDIGLGGARLRLDGAAPRNLEVRLTHAHATPLYATRAWAAAGIIGVAFAATAPAHEWLALRAVENQGDLIALAERLGTKRLRIDHAQSGARGIT